MNLLAIGSAMNKGRIWPSELLAGLLLLGLGLVGWHFATPWIMPLRVTAGPFVQRCETQSLTLSWFTTRPADCAVEVVTDAGPRKVAAKREGLRHTATIDGLAPGQTYQYSLKAGETALPEVGGVAHTAPPSSSRSARFVVFGDSGHGYREQYLLAKRIEDAQPDFIVHTGDLIYPGGEREHYRDRFFVPYRAVLQRAPFWPSIGNHDHADASAYLEYFDLPGNGPADAKPERHYWFDWGAARFVIVDSNAKEAELATVVAPWVESTFAGFEGDWRFVVFHHPPHTAGRYPPDAKMTKTLVPAMQRAGVDVVFNGHDHMYERTHPLIDGARDDVTGIVYIVSGAGGAKLYQPRDPTSLPSNYALRHHTAHSFTTVELTPDGLRATQQTVDGTLLDEWTLPQRRARTASQPG
ncbi:MAG: metallophosphoesterase [Phycisphaerae bacterium]|nr:metallophosphoesterase [Phycisphaerae bacterium]